ncbi:hypothetical protein [Aliikangiella coralliicola]|uniref:Uncharacterized protein n=1 Tax=Aliikangiella coralliicola TaxID=2592383 RepID=A0A545UGV0_9GAMM|nr:hypothetical protein [Aliikangiella coralliicola]TQV88701.1 hypothetical protein FLL46_04000 [Aliikangiella coralliicola]
MYIKLAVITCIFLLNISNISKASVDLAIADDETYKRPNAWAQNLVSPHSNSKVLLTNANHVSSRPGVSIAWRNANQVEEVEVRVLNFGDEPSMAKVYVDIVDESGAQLLHLEPPEELRIIRVPAYSRGGKEGKILRMKADWGLNALIDRFDIARIRYHVKATVEAQGVEDSNLLNNSKVKSWNIPFRVNPNQTNSYNYTFTNHHSKTKKLKWMFEHTPYPRGWFIEGVPEENNEITLKPGESIYGTLTMKAPSQVQEGDFLEARLSLVDMDENRIFMQNEWFQIYDTKPPSVTDYRLISLDDGTLAIQALVSDHGSGILEATGVSTEFSVDGGKTWARKAHNYKVGNFVRPTLFETVIGPFKSGTKVQLRFTAKDTAGNAATIIPEDAVSFFAPPGANQLLENAYIFPRTQKNPIFEIDKLQEIQVNLKKLKKQGIPLESVDFSKPNKTGVDPIQLSAMGIGPSRYHEVIADLKRIEGITLDFSKVIPMNIKRLNTDIDKMLNLTTIEVVAR